MIAAEYTGETTAEYTRRIELTRIVAFCLHLRELLGIGTVFQTMIEDKTEKVRLGCRNFAEQ